MGLEVQNKHFYVKHHKGVFVLLGFIFALSVTALIKTSNASAWSAADCMSSARSVIGSDIVSANQETFQERCNTSTGSSGTYGMIYIDVYYIPELTGPTSFSMSLKRTTISSSTSVSRANAYVCTSASGISMSSNMEGWTSGTKGKFSAGSGSGTIWIYPGDISWSNSGGLFKYTFYYKSCLNASSCSSSCHDFPMIVYMYKVSDVSASSWVSGVSGASWDGSRYKVNSSNGSVSVSFGHSASRNDSWSNGVTSGQWKTCIAESKNGSCSPDTSSHTSNTINTTLEPDSSKTVCSRLRYPSRVGLAGYSKSLSYNYTKAACVTLYREEPTYYGSFSGSLSFSLPPSNVTLISGTSYLGTYNGGPYSVTVTKSLKRTDSESRLTNPSAYGVAQNCSWTGSAWTCSDYCPNGSCATISSTSLGIGASTSNTHTVSMSPSNGSSQTICQRLNYVSAISKKGSTQSNNSWAQTSPTCYTVYQPARATFSGSIDNPWAVDNRIAKTSGLNMLGNGEAELFLVNTKYRIKRTNNSPNVAASKYTTSMTSQPTTASTLIPDTKINVTREITDNSEGKFKQNLNTKGTHCFYMTYENTVDYYADTNRLSSRVTLDKINKCVTIYSPLIGTFTASVDVGSSNLTGSASAGFRGNGYDTAYTLTGYYQVKHNNVVPTTAVSRYNFTSASSTSYPTTAKYNTPALGINETMTTPQTINITVANGKTITQCFALSYDARVGYVDSAILTTPFDAREFTGRASKCVSIYNPNKWDATFSGSITVSNSSYLSNHSSIANRKVGNGLRSRYYLTPTYTVTRTNNSPTWAVAPQYAYSDSAYPTSATNTFKALSYNEKDSTTASAREIIVPIDSSVSQCFYLSFDNPVIYIDNVLDKRVFNGRKRECYTLENPHQEYTSHYTATTTGRIDAHEKLELSNNNLVGRIDNIRRITGTNTDTDGSWVDAFPSDSNYTATFTHTITRTDDDKSSDMLNVYYVKKTKVNWRLQYCIDTGCTANYYTTYLATDDTNTGLRTSGEAYLSAHEAITFTTKPHWTLNASNKGKYIYTCHRIQYNDATSYSTKTNTSDYNSYVDNIWSYNSTNYTTPVCVTIKNPRWENNIIDTNYPYHYIDVRGKTGGLTVSGANKLNGTNYETTKMTSILYWDHTIARYDNNTVRSTNFDETDSGVNFYQPSIYNDPTYSVSTRMWGQERMPGTRTNAKLINPIQGNGTVNGYPLTLNAGNKDGGQTWSSNASNGRTYTTFTAAVSGDYSLLAGITKNISQSTVNSRAAWYVRYKHIYRQEVYTGAWTGKTGSQFYDRTEKLDTAPQLTTPVTYDSEDQVNYTITRPYNFEITNVEPASVPDAIAYEGDTFRIDYNINVDKENTFHEYITDPNHTDNARYVYVINYILDTSTSASQASNVTGEGIANDPCGYFNSVAKSGSCEVISTMNSDAVAKTGHPDKLKQGTHQGDPDPTANVSFRNVYDRQSYALSYSTGTITVPKIPVGNKYCVAIAIRNYTSVSSSGYYISSSVCRNVSKRPNFQIWGGSVLSAGGIKTSRIKSQNKLYGSWADFVAVANGNIKNMVSGAYTISGALGTSSLCDLSPMTISNTLCYDKTKPDALGNASIYTRSDFIEKLLEYIPSTSTSLSAIPSGEIQTGQYIIKNNGTVTITRDIVVDTSVDRTVSDVPQVIIIAKEINIKDTVNRIDALLIATGEGNTGGTINTCTTESGETIALSNTTCTEDLRVNGALVGSKILMRRTYGADPAENTTAEAAEVVNYTPATIIWGYSSSRVTGLPNVVYQKKLPPRF